MDEKSVKLLNTSLDSGLQRATKKHRSKTSRLLRELTSDLGPRFSFSEDAQSGNLRSKYGRLQKVNESAGTGYVPTDLLRMRKISSSPNRSPTKNTTPIVIKEEPSNEDQTNVVVIVAPKDDPPSEPEEREEEAKEEVKDQQVERMDVAFIGPESEGATDAPVEQKVEDAMEVDMQEESVAIVVVQDSPGSTDKNPPSLEMKPSSPVVVKLEREEPHSLLLPPPPPQLTSTSTTGVPRRLSMRRMTILATPEPPPPIPAQIKHEPKTIDCTPVQELRRGVFISPEFLNHEKFLAVQHLTPGALIWGILGKYPPWPCMIVEDDKGHFMRQVAGRHFVLKCFVRFFGPKGLNSWINSNSHIPFDAVDIAEDLREGTWAGRKGCQGKLLTELQWAIEDAQLVAVEQDWTKRMQVFDSILLEQHE